jgi:cytochrome P450
MHNPVPQGNLNTFARDSTLPNGMKIKKGERFFLDFHGLHHNPKEWIDPEKFIPERFNPSSPYYLTPAGKKRKMSSYSPFFGGERICLGIPFAKYLVKTVFAYAVMSFDFELVEQPKHFPDKHIDVVLLKQPKFMVNLTPYKSS